MQAHLLARGDILGLIHYKDNILRPSYLHNGIS